jgi:hypothetical protein
MTADDHRGRRVRFKHPVRVTTIDGEPRAWRTLSANLSRHGLFVRMPQPLEPGTRVAISLEARGQALPLAQGEVRWCRYNLSELDGRFQGCGVRFTDYLHPRAGELVEYLVESLDTGKPLKVAPRRRRWWPMVALLGAAAVSCAAILLVPNAPLPLPAANEGPGPLAVVAVAPRTTEELAAAVSPAVDEAEPGNTEPEKDAPTPAIALLEPTPPPPASALSGEVPTTRATAVASLEAVAAPLEPPTLARVASPTLALAATPAPVAVPPSPPEPTAASAASPRPAPDAMFPPAVAALTPRSSSEATALRAAARRPPSPRGEPADGQLRLPSGAATAVSWRASPEGLDVRPELRADSHVARVFALSDPPRLVFDIEGSPPARSHAMAPSSALITRVRLGKQGNRTRVVLDLASQPHRVTAATDHALVQF